MRLIFGGFAAFLITCVLLFLLRGHLAPSANPEPALAVDEIAHPSPDGTFVVTLDTSDRKHFRPFDFGQGRIRPQGPSDLPTDLLARRHTLRAPYGALRLGKVPLARATLPAHPDWVRDKEISGELQNPALKDWYSYSYWTHVLHALGDTYAVRLAGGGVAYLNILSYYCKPEGSGCLSIRYRLQLE